MGIPSLCDYCAHYVPGEAPNFEHRYCSIGCGGFPVPISKTCKEWCAAEIHPAIKNMGFGNLEEITLTTPDEPMPVQFFNKSKIVGMLKADEWDLFTSGGYDEIKVGTLRRMMKKNLEE